MNSILQLFDFRQRRRETLKNSFLEAFKVSFPETEGHRKCISGQIMDRLVEVGGEAEAARVERDNQSENFANLDKGVAMIKLRWLIMASKVAEAKEKEYKQLLKLAREAGFSKDFFEEVQRRIKVAGAQGGLVFKVRASG